MEAVEDLVSAVKSTVEDSNFILKELVVWKPHVRGAPQEMHANIATP
jgi:hypothetical protein